MSEVHTETGGVSWGLSLWGAWTAPWPFAGLWVSPEHIQVIANVFGFEAANFKFNRQEIASIAKYSNFFGDAIRIKHTKKEYSPFILFGTLNYRKLEDTLIKMGYTVDEDEDRRS